MLVKLAPSGSKQVGGRDGAKKCWNHSGNFEIEYNSSLWLWKEIVSKFFTLRSLNSFESELYVLISSKLCFFIEEEFDGICEDLNLKSK